MPDIVGDRDGCTTLLDADRAIEARAAAGVAGRIVPGDRNLQPDGVLIAVGADFLHRLQIAGAFALLPQALARAAVIVGDTGLDRQRQRLGVHVRDHE
ncbi:hypothetical protein D3C87_1980420 [compost metagenome]